MSTVTLNNGVEMPAIGLGVFQTPPEETRAAVEAALATGYRHIDTAAAYGNEREVGEAVAKSGARVFLETKIWISDYGYEETLHAFEKSAASSASSTSTCSSCTRRCRRPSTRPSRRTAPWRRCSSRARSAPSGSATSWSSI